MSALLGIVRRIPALLAMAVVRAYQLLISPLLGPRCRFYPSCSEYALIALRRWGLLRGGWLAIRRLGHCHPWNPGGVDLVPERGEPSRRPDLDPTRVA